MKLFQMQDFGHLANYVPNSALRLALTAVLPKTLLSFKKGASHIPSSGTLGYLPASLDSVSADTSTPPPQLEVDNSNASPETKNDKKEQVPPELSIASKLSPLTNDQEQPSKVSADSSSEESESKKTQQPTIYTIPSTPLKSTHANIDTLQAPRLASGAEGKADAAPATLTLNSASLSAKIDISSRRLSYFETSSGATTPDDEQQKRLGDILSSEKGLRALRRLSKTVPNSQLTIEDSGSELGGSTPSLASLDADTTAESNGSEQALMEELADAIGVDLYVDDEQADKDQKSALLEVKPNDREASTTGWATATASRAVKTATWQVYG